MTKLLPGKTLVRETGTLERTDPIVVELHVRGLVVRVKGRPGTGRFFLGYDAILDLGRKLAAREHAAAGAALRRAQDRASARRRA